MNMMVNRLINNYDCKINKNFRFLIIFEAPLLDSHEKQKNTTNVNINIIETIHPYYS